jgi:hypothetical protein
MTANSFLAKYHAVPCDAKGRPAYHAPATAAETVVAHAETAIAGWDAGVRTATAAADLFRLAVEMEYRRQQLIGADGLPVPDRTPAERKLARLAQAVTARIGRYTDVFEAVAARKLGR